VVLWFNWLSGSGKSTGLMRLGAVDQAGLSYFVLDGDNVRHVLLFRFLVFQMLIEREYWPFLNLANLLVEAGVIVLNSF